MMRPSPNHGTLRLLNDDQKMVAEEEGGRNSDGKLLGKETPGKGTNKTAETIDNSRRPERWREFTPKADGNSGRCPQLQRDPREEEEDHMESYDTHMSQAVTRFPVASRTLLHPPTVIFPLAKCFRSGY